MAKRKRIPAEKKTTTFPYPGGFAVVKSAAKQPAVLRRISKMLGFAPTEVYPTNGFVAFTKTPKQKIDPKSYFTLRLGRRGTLATMGCPPGQWDPRTGRCKRGKATIQRVLVPHQRVLAAMRPAVIGRPRVSVRAAMNPKARVPSDKAAAGYITRCLGWPPDAIQRLMASQPAYWKQLKAQAKRELMRVSRAYPSGFAMVPPIPSAMVGRRADLNPLPSGSHHRAGKFDKASRWYPDEAFQVPGSFRVRAPSRRWPFSNLKHFYTDKYMKMLQAQRPDLFAQLMENPLLMTVQNPAPRTASIPFKRGQKVPRARFEQWLLANHPEMRGQYQNMIAQYKRFHLGTNPATISFDLLPLGGKAMLPPEFMYSAGRSTTETYTPPGGSGKAPSSFYHKYKTQPEVLIGGDGSLVLKPLRGTAKVTDWFYG